MAVDDILIFEEVLDSIGSMGFAQVLLIILSVAAEATVGLSMNVFVLEGSNPGYSCVPVYNKSVNSSIGHLYGNRTERECPTETVDCINMTFSDQFTSILTEWNLICDRYYLVKATASVYFAGLFVGAISGGQLADSFGRRKILLIFWAILIVFQACLTFASSLSVYMTLRFVAGVCCGTCAAMANTLPIEYVGKKWRNLVAIRFGWRIAHFLIVLLAYYLRSWRHLTLGVSLPFTVFLLIAYFCMPESARWLIQKRRFAEAEKCLRFVAKLNRKPPPEHALVEKLFQDVSAESGTGGHHYWYLDLFGTKKFAIRSSVLIMGWFTCSTMSYGLKAEMAGLAGSIYENLAIAAALNAFCSCTAPLIVTGIGRRPAYPIFMIYPVICMITILSMDVTGQMEGREMVRTGLAVSSYAASVGSWQAVFILSNEAYPTLMRNIACGAGNTAARLAGVVAPQIGLLTVLHPSIPYVVFGVLAIVASIFMAIFMPETKNKPLPDALPPRVQLCCKKKCQKEAVNETDGSDRGAEVEMTLMEGKQNTIVI